MSAQRGQMKVLSGTVVSNKMDKTIVVRVSRSFKHPKYKKFITMHKKYHAHDPNNEANIGDDVLIGSSRPLSKTKRWRLEEITRKVAQL